MDILLLPTCYLPPASYFAVMMKNQALDVLIEQHEHFPKQTYRSRTSILGANGQLDLYIPVKKGKDHHTKMKDVQISYNAEWQRLHWLSIQTAYRSSAYFEYYEDDFAPFYEQKTYPFLLDYNIELTQLLLKLLRIEKVLGLTAAYHKEAEGIHDLRTLIHPKKPVVAPIKPYRQVFSDRHDFIPNLSIVDLLFNHGPQSAAYLL